MAANLDYEIFSQTKQILDSDLVLGQRFSRGLGKGADRVVGRYSTREKLLVLEKVQPD